MDLIHVILLWKINNQIAWAKSFNDQPDFFFQFLTSLGPFPLDVWISLSIKTRQKSHKLRCLPQLLRKNSVLLLIPFPVLQQELLEHGTSHNCFPAKRQTRDAQETIFRSQKVQAPASGEKNWLPCTDRVTNTKTMRFSSPVNVQVH